MFSTSFGAPIMSVPGEMPAVGDGALEDVRTCILCLKEGVPTYSGLRDYTFGTGGVWDYRECTSCGLLWLSPRPVRRDIGKYYATYLTHKAKSDHSSSRKFYDKFKLALWARTLRQPALAPDWRWAQIARIARLDPFVRQIGRMGTMYLDGVRPGRLLDVGCGNGSFLALMQSAGWEVVGTEPDLKAAKLASERLRVPIHTQEVCKIAFEPSSFDAVTLHHVIEHVHDPVALIADCRRVLKPGGRLVMITPNLWGSGHRWFDADWRGLEPPRHLHVFSPHALTAAAERAGIRVDLLETSPRSAPGNWIESRVISRRRVGAPEKQSSLLAALAFLVWQRASKVLRPETGEELVLVGTVG